eukprot:jgi/Hompol1/1972/HPOL_005032-RA
MDPVKSYEIKAQNNFYESSHSSLIFTNLLLFSPVTFLQDQMQQQSKTAKFRRSNVSIQAENQHLKRIKEENRLQLQREIERKVAWKHDLKRLEDMTSEEVMLANQEFLILRRKELKELFECDMAR